MKMFSRFLNNWFSYSTGFRERKASSNSFLEYFCPISSIVSSFVISTGISSYDFVVLIVYSWTSFDNQGSTLSLLKVPFNDVTIDSFLVWLKEQE